MEVTGDRVHLSRLCTRFIPHMDLVHIVFEITERETVRKATLLEVFTSGFKADGSRFAIEGFGSGVSTMTYFKRFSMDFLTMEGDFIRVPFQTGFIDRSILASIATLIQVIAIQTVAESVESPETSKMSAAPA
jgi:EAL domain-containing protein (putative c-di-GMP-specific phosphodiesterase class I)